MNNGTWFLEFLKLVFLLTGLLILYSIVNTFMIMAAGGMDAIDGAGLGRLFFILQVAGLLSLTTVLYRNKLQRRVFPDQKPLTQVWTKRLIAFGIAAVVASYLILIIVILF
ncbi:hypothetical protein FLK61_25325 [Paenalkalicoccus suaedae]|uniref:Uncharacterized protein n=1 Tax=Paenalkalicoccus suaedae TaxID=2592382 RepID=A0A859FD00_9BACI|nr:hypothetical protein [Paenalkalicoccus suaedae]QKS70096.1 hypothetical protein FLK61_25325 [Paenalkalicoccus suaedae]